MTLHLTLNGDRRYELVDGNERTLIRDPWNPASDWLVDPRQPATEGVWRPSALRRGPEPGLYGLFLQNRENRHVVEWVVGSDGTYISQHPSDEADLFRHIATGTGVVSPEQIEWCYWSGYPQQAERLATVTLRRLGWHEGLVNFLIVVREHSERAGRAGWLKRARQRRASTPLPDLLLQNYGVGGPEHNEFIGQRSKRILYLVQTEAELDPGLAEAFVSDDSDYLCLTFRRRVWRPHYMFAPGTTWTAGRNVLFEVAKRSFPGYDYYVLSDDDVIFDGRSRVDAVRHFNAWLLREQPEIGVCATPWHRQWGCFYSESEATSRVSGFDALFNAFRSDVFREGVLFPYVESYDHVTWWTSQLILLELTARYYEPVQLNELSVDSGQDRPYPRNPIPGDQTRALAYLLTSMNLEPTPAGEEGASVRRRRRLKFNKEARDKLYRTKLFS